MIGIAKTLSKLLYRVFYDSSVVDSLVNRYSGAGLTGAEREANAFTAAESEKAREWQERMYLKYESPVGQVSQLKAAGLNPALMYGQAPTGSVDSSPAMGSVSPSAPENLLGVLMQFATLKADIDKTKAETRNINANTFGKETENQYLAEQIQLGLNERKINIDAALAGIRKIDSEIGLNTALARVYDSDVELKNSQISLNQIEEGIKVLQKSLIIAQTNSEYKKAQMLDLDIVKGIWEKEFRDSVHYSPDQPLWNAVTSVFGSLFVELGKGFDKLFNLSE